VGVASAHMSGSSLVEPSSGVWGKGHEWLKPLAPVIHSAGTGHGTRHSTRHS